MNVLDYFDAAFVINLDRRQDRMTRFTNQASQLGLTVERFSAKVATAGVDYVQHQDWFYRPALVGNTLSHQGIVRIARGRGLRNVLIFEDDCVFHEDFMAKVRPCIEELRGVPWDLFYLGCNLRARCDALTPHLMVTKGVWCAHAYAVNASFFDTVLSIDHDVFDCADHGLLHLHGQHVICRELLAWQEDGVSDLRDMPAKNVREQYAYSYSQYASGELA